MRSDQSDPGRGLPVSSELSMPFWEATRAERLTSPRCPACDQRFFPPSVVCPGCLSEGWEWAPSEGRGRVAEFTTVHRAPSAEISVPYVIASVELDEGWMMLTNLVDVDHVELRVDLPVQVQFMPTRDPQIVLPVFAPIAEVPS